MYQSSNTQRGQWPVATRGDSPVSVIGAGIAGAWQALLFAQAGRAVTLPDALPDALPAVKPELAQAATRHAAAPSAALRTIFSPLPR